jgi:ATP-dependent DNA ligase
MVKLPDRPWLTVHRGAAVNPPVEPMLARSVPEIPTGEGMTYEPTWDGFRCVIVRDGDEAGPASRGGRTGSRAPATTAGRSSRSSQLAQPLRFDVEQVRAGTR